MADELIVDDADGVRTITINRPEVKNALTAAMRAEFCALVEAADGDDSLRAVIVTAVDPVFSAGVDFKEVASGAGSGSPASSNPGAALRAAAKPTVCAVNGACVTGALELALSCTFIVAAENAWSQIAVRGRQSLETTYLEPGKKDKADPLGQRGYAGTAWWKAVMVENPGWMAVGNVGVKTLS